MRQAVTAALSIELLLPCSLDVIRADKVARTAPIVFCVRSSMRVKSLCANSPGTSTQELICLTGWQTLIPWFGEAQVAAWWNGRFHSAAQSALRLQQSQ